MENFLLHPISLILLALLFLPEFNSALKNRSKRFLLFPNNGGPKMVCNYSMIIYLEDSSKKVLKFFVFYQCIKMALGLPVHLELETVIVGYAIQSKFRVPTNVTQTWYDVTHPFVERSIKKRATKQQIDYEDEGEYNSQADKSDDHEEEANNHASMRWTVYKMFAEIAERCIYAITLNLFFDALFKYNIFNDSF